MDGVTDRHAEQTELTGNSVSGEGGEPSVAAPIVAKSVVADPPAAGLVAVASSILDPVVPVPPAVMAGHRGGEVKKVNEKRMGKIASDLPLQVNQMEEPESNVDADLR
ncbi:uncharacterized [Tachysurus ichikawai]